MNSPLVLIFIGLAFVVLFGGLSLFRREGLSMRFAAESLVLSALAAGLAFFGNLKINPVLFLIVLYLITMRVRLLVDLGSVFARQNRFAWADRLFSWAGKLWPDTASQLILKVNQATLDLQQNKLDEAINQFNAVLQQAGQGFLGVKYEAVSHYNLGVAYQRKHQPARATIEFNAVVDTWPTSLYAQRAQEALDKLRMREEHSSDR